MPCKYKIARSLPQRLQHILEAPETLFPEQALLNAVARHRAVLLLRRIDELFI